MPAIAVIRIKLIYKIKKFKIGNLKLNLFFDKFLRLKLMGLDTPVN